MNTVQVCNRPNGSRIVKSNPPPHTGEGGSGEERDKIMEQMDQDVDSTEAPPTQSLSQNADQQDMSSS